MSSSLVLVANAGDSSISTFRVTDAGLDRLSVTAGTTGCSNFAVDAERGFVYASVKADDDNADAGILTLSLDRETGVLTPQSRVSLPGGAMNYLSLTRDGSVLLGAAYSGGYGIVCAVGAGGEVSAPAAEVRFPRLHSVMASADGRHSYFVSLETDLVAQFSLESDLSLTPLDPPTADAPAGSGPRHLAFSDDQQTVYVLTEFTGEVLRYHATRRRGRSLWSIRLPRTTRPRSCATASSTKTLGRITTCGAPTSISPTASCGRPSARRARSRHSQSTPTAPSPRPPDSS